MSASSHIGHRLGTVVRGMRVLLTEGPAGVRSRFDQRRWRRIEERTDAVTELVKRQLATGRDLYDGLDEHSRRELIELKNAHAVAFHRRVFDEVDVREYARTYFEKALQELEVHPEIFHGKAVAEVGSGPVGMLNDCGAAEIVNIDPCIDNYKRHVRGFPQAFPNIRFVNAYAEDVPLDSGSFDIIVSVNALDHFNDVNGAISEIARLLKDDGLFLLSVDCKDRHVFTRTVKHVGHPFSFTPRRLRNLVADDFELLFFRQLAYKPRVVMHLRKRQQA